MKIQDIWKLLEEEKEELNSGYITRRLLPELDYDVLLAIEKPLNIRLLMLRVKKSSILKGVVFPKSSSFEVRRVILANDSDIYITIQLLLTNSRYKDIFTTLLQDLVDNLSHLSDEKDAINEFIARLRRWQAFLEKHGNEGLSQNQQQGLYGELWLLRHLIIPQLGSRQGIQCWSGPKGTQQDFQFPNCAVEVKTTAQEKHQQLSISSERQLDNTNLGTLVLLHLSLDVRQGRGETLPEIINNIRTIVEKEPIVKEELDILFLEVGYLDIHTPQYEQIGYSLREINYFKVEENFPRIIEKNLLNGVGNVRYTISVAECKRFSITELEVISLIKYHDE